MDFKGFYPPVIIFGAQVNVNTIMPRPQAKATKSNWERCLVASS